MAKWVYALYQSHKQKLKQLPAKVSKKLASNKLAKGTLNLQVQNLKFPSFLLVNYKLTQLGLESMISPSILLLQENEMLFELKIISAKLELS